jgi:hypothetical protein
MDYICSHCNWGLEYSSTPKKHPLPTQLTFPESWKLTSAQPQANKASRDRADRLHDAECEIVKLPNELLHQILDLGADMSSIPWRNKCYTGIIELIAVCKRFREVGTPILYHTVHFEKGCGNVPPCIPAKLFHRTMRENPLLRSLCKALYISIFDRAGTRSWSDYKLTNELFTWLPNVNSFTINGGFDDGHAEHTWTLIRNAIECMPFISEFSIGRTGNGGLTIPPIIEHLDLPGWKKFSVSGITGAEMDGYGNREDATPLPEVIDSQLCRSSCVTENHYPNVEKIADKLPGSH